MQPRLLASFDVAGYMLFGPLCQHSSSGSHRVEFDFDCSGDDGHNRFDGTANGGTLALAGPDLEAQGSACDGKTHTAHLAFMRRQRSSVRWKHGPISVGAGHLEVTA